MIDPTKEKPSGELASLGATLTKKEASWVAKKNAIIISADDVPKTGKVIAKKNTLIQTPYGNVMVPKGASLSYGANIGSVKATTSKGFGLPSEIGVHKQNKVQKLVTHLAAGGLLGAGIASSIASSTAVASSAAASSTSVSGGVGSLGTVAKVGSVGFFDSLKGTFSDVFNEAVNTAKEEGKKAIQNKLKKALKTKATKGDVSTDQTLVPNEVSMAESTAPETPVAIGSETPKWVIPAVIGVGVLGLVFAARR